jgi:hypothetical protein
LDFGFFLREGLRWWSWFLWCIMLLQSMNWTFLLYQTISKIPTRCNQVTLFMFDNCCTIWLRYGLNTKHLHRTLHTYFRHRKLLSCSSRWFLRTMQKTFVKIFVIPEYIMKRPVFYCLWHIWLNFVCLCALSQFSNLASAMSRQFCGWSLSGRNSTWYQ